MSYRPGGPLQAGRSVFPRTVTYGTRISDLHILDTLAHEEVSAIDVFGPRMQLRVIRNGDGGLVVHTPYPFRQGRVLRVRVQLENVRDRRPPWPLRKQP